MNFMKKLLFLMVCTAAVCVFADYRPALIVKHTPTLQNIKSLSVDGWFYFTEYQQAARIVSKYNHTIPDGKGRGWELNMNKQKLEFRLHAQRTDGSHQDFIVTSVDDIPIKRWVHLAAVYADEGNGNRRMTVYIDGKESKSVKPPMNIVIYPNSEVDVYLGCYAWSFGAATNMLVDDFRISNKIRHFTQAPDKPADPNEAGTLLLYSFDKEPFFAKGIVSGLVGDTKLVPGKFGKALDMTAPIDKIFYKKAAIIGRDLEMDDILRGDMRLWVYTYQKEANFQLFNSHKSPLNIKLTVKDVNGKVLYFATKRIDKQLEWKFPIDNLADGNYSVSITDADGKIKGSFLRRLRIQHPQTVPAPAEPVELTDTLIFPVDNYHFASRTNVENKVVPAKVNFTVIPEKKWMKSEGSRWINITPDGTIIQRIITSGNYQQQSYSFANPKIIYAVGKDGNFKLLEKHPFADDNAINLHPPYYSSPDARPEWWEKHPFDSSVVRPYDPAKDGIIPVKNVRIACLATHVVDAKKKGLIPWGSYPVVERKKGEWIIMNQQPLCVAKFGYADHELETAPDANDNFGGQWLSDDGKTNYYMQAAKVRAFYPRHVEYDNIYDSARLMRIFYSTDGINWKCRYVFPPDEKDHPTMQHYGSSSFKAAPAMRIGVIHAYDVEKQQIFSEIVYTRDDINWVRLDDRTPFIGNTYDKKSPLFGMIFTEFATNPVYENNGMYYIALGNPWHRRPHFYEISMKADVNSLKNYYISRKLAERWPFFNTIGGWEGLAEELQMIKDGTSTSIGYATIKKDRWIAAAGKNAVFTSRVWNAPDCKMIINGNGSFKVELFDTNNNPIPQYSGVNAATFEGDDIAHTLSWNGIETLPATPFKAVISMAQGELFTIKLAK